MRKILPLLALSAILGMVNVQSSFAQSPQPEELFCGRPVSSFSHVIDGTPGDDSLNGTPGDDLIRGFAGNDRIFGGGGNDCLKGYEGSDGIWGGAGNDYIMGLGDGDRLVGDDGDDVMFGGDGNDDIWGNADGDRLVGEAGNDEIHGDSGDDSVYGDGGDDYLWGGAGNDTMAGGADNDKLVGDEGDDSMWGGAGDDDLVGLAGDDKMVGDSGNDRLYGNGGDDALYDDAGDDALNGGDDIDHCYDAVGTNTFFACDPFDPQDSAKQDFDIKSFGIENNELFMQVYGQAGATVPEKPDINQFGQVFVYVFATDNGIWVINAHWECHEGATGCDPNETHVSEWHAEKVAVGKVDGFSNPCVTGISNERPATVDGHFARVSVPEASKIFSAQTAAYDIKTNPDDPQQECIAELSEIFDQA